MTNCRELIELLDDYAADALAPPVRAAFEEHLARCPYCCDYLKTYRDSINLAKSAIAGREERVRDSVPEELIRAVIAARKKTP